MSESEQREIDGLAVELYPERYNMANIDINLKERKSWIAGTTAMAEKKNEEIENLKSVMIAAAEEIQEHWPAHCDKEGYGPANLMHRLEKGIPSSYAYKAGDFARLQTDFAKLKDMLDYYKNKADQAEKILRTADSISFTQKKP